MKVEYRFFEMEMVLDFLLWYLLELYNQYDVGFLIQVEFSCIVMFNIDLFSIILCYSAQRSFFILCILEVFFGVLRLFQ